jgi:hypothetical protein
MPIDQFPKCSGVSPPGAGDQLDLAHTAYRHTRRAHGWVIAFCLRESVRGLPRVARRRGAALVAGRAVCGNLRSLRRIATAAEASAHLGWRIQRRDRLGGLIHENGLAA